MKTKIIIGTIVCSVFLNGCSVFMAAKHEGVEPQKVMECKTRSCIIAAGAEPINKVSKNEETFKAQMPTGSTSRAVLNGTLDVFTLGLWEAAGTPIEGSLNKEEIYTFKVKYKDNLEDIESFVK